jgi:hypothetical protein
MNASNQNKENNSLNTRKSFEKKLAAQKNNLNLIKMKIDRVSKKYASLNEDYKSSVSLEEFIDKLEPSQLKKFNRLMDAITEDIDKRNNSSAVDLKRKYKTSEIFNNKHVSRMLIK